jgi:hypothetical protein
MQERFGQHRAAAADAEDGGGGGGGGVELQIKVLTTGYWPTQVRRSGPRRAAAAP